MYDEQAISTEFRELAARADAEYREFVRGKASSDRDGDAILARSCVYGYLYARYFLETIELLRNELRWLKRTGRPQPPKHAQSAERFNASRDELLDALIERFGPGAGS
jgi:hypothetical protein